MSLNVTISSPIQKLHITTNVQLSMKTTTCPSATPATPREPKPVAQVEKMKVAFSIVSISFYVFPNVVEWSVVRRQAVPLQRVRRSVQPAGQPEDSLPHSLRGEAIPLRHLWRSLCSGETFWSHLFFVALEDFVILDQQISSVLNELH